MAHYAFLDNNNIVTEVITGIDENELIEGLTPEEWYGKFRNQRCIRTSYNGNIRKCYAGIGFRYDEVRDIFIAPQPYISWFFDEESLEWKAPKPYPEDNEIYIWNEEIKEWEPVNGTT
jgi:hypothetical protein